jgi:quercetin dioxygenase-like cupin family protein
VNGAPIRLSPAQTLVITASTPERLEIEATWTTGGGPPPMHWHPLQQEHFEVLTGELTVGLGDAAPRVLQAGATLDVPPRTAHRMWNAGEHGCTARWVVTPALRTAEMFRTIERSRSRLGTAARLLISHRAEFRFGAPRG